MIYFCVHLLAMNKKGRISYLSSYLALALGLLTISVTLFQYAFEDKLEHNKSITNKKQDKTGNETQLYLPDYQATLSSFQLHIDQIPRFQENIPVIIFIRTWNEKHFFLTGIDYFKTLFQHIISPNAP